MTEDQSPAPEPKAKAPKAKDPDPFELHWLGGPEPVVYLPGVPADHLTAHQVDRLVYERTVGTIPSPDHDEGVFLVRGLRSGDEGFDQIRGDLVASLRATGLYGDAPEGK